MGKILELVRNSPKRMSAIIAVTAAVVMVPAALFAWGPNRETYTIQKPADHVVFNSITNNPAHGDERNFVQVKEATASNSAYAESANVAAGKEYTVFVYYHNNAATSLNASGKGIAKDVSAKVQIPAIVPNGSTGTKSVGYVSASNANPGTVWDDISFKNSTGGDVALRYVAGSAVLHNKGQANGSKLSDTIVTTGAKLGYNKLDGIVPGCEQYAGYVTFNVVADQANFTVEKKVKKTSDSTWTKNIEVNPGDKVDYLIGYKNTGTTTQNNIVVKDKLPAGITYQAGTTQLKNANFPNKKTLTDELTTSTGVNIGNYGKGSNAYVYFTAKVADKDKLTCGPNTLVNKATVETNNGSKSDEATVVVKNDECKEPVKIKVCELDTKKIITIDEKNFDSNKHSKNLEDCKEVTKEVEVCNPATGEIITVDEKDADKYAPVGSDKCKEMKVCVIKDKTVEIIKTSDFNADIHTTDMSVCKKTPEVPETPENPKAPQTPAELPKTGPADMVATLAAVVSLTASSAYYVASRRQG